MKLTDAQKLEILRANPAAHAVYQQPLKYGDSITVLVKPSNSIPSLTLPLDVAEESVRIRPSKPFTDLRLALKYANTVCYNEPVPGGVQIQPMACPWVGTLGAGCSFKTLAGDVRWGILSNWHVLCPDNAQRGLAICQPLDDMPPIAHLTDWETVSPAKVNMFDAAVADAKIDGLHTIGPMIKCVGRPNPAIVDPKINMRVSKCGRTTDLTNGYCEAIDAAVQVGYGDFTATFTGQALFKGSDEPFSAPGDSGSLILNADNNHPVALLFAGNDELTVGSPLQPIANRFNLSFYFPEN